MWGCSCEKRRVQRRSLVHFKLHRPASGSDMQLAIGKRSLHDADQYQKAFAGSHRFCNRPPCCCNYSMICKLWGMTACSYRDNQHVHGACCTYAVVFQGMYAKSTAAPASPTVPSSSFFVYLFPKTQRTSDNPWKCRKLRRPEGRVISDR
jgi:hypothetical protein